jgi:MFS transporter, DHA1 family, inner membrane transport protein
MRARIQLATLATYLTADFVAPLAPRLGRALGRDLDPAVLVVPFCATFALAFPVWGRIADRHRAGAALAASLGGLALFGVVLACAPSYALVLVARAGAGAFAAGVPPTAQALLAARAGDGATGRAVSAMMVAVAVATLGGPLVAAPLADLAGWRAASVLLGVLPALAAAVACAPLASWAPSRRRDRVHATPALAAGWGCAALVLAAYWTLVTRWSSIAGGAGTAAALLPLAGLAGIMLVVVAGRAADRRGPRTPMVLTTVAGAAGYALAAATSSRALFLAGLAVAVAAYWSYLPIVAAQVQRAAPEAMRASAAGLLYSSMWLGAALGGLAAAAAGDPRVILAGAAVSWTGAAVVAWRGFLAHPIAERAA